VSHASGLNRSAFTERIEEGQKIAADDPVIGSLWNCTDIMPSHVCDELEMPAGSNYAQAVRRLRAA
jgi:hypothetical protein